MKEKIAIIGNGNMGKAITSGLLSRKIVIKNQIFLTDSKTKNNKEAVQKAEIIILAVKPQVIKPVLEEIKNCIKNQLVVSILAGVTIKYIQENIGKKIAVVRVMPNLAAKVGQSMSVFVCSKEVNKTQKKLLKIILNAIGKELELQNEEQINSATAISGSGPAYFFYLTEVLGKGAIKLGFTKEEARLLAKQTLLGSADLLQASTYSAEELRHAVTSKGGVTECAILEFKKANLQAVILNGIFSAFNKAQELSNKFCK